MSAGTYSWHFIYEQLPWFTVKWKKTLTNPEPFCGTNIGETDLS